MATDVILSNALIRDAIARLRWPHPQGGQLHILGVRGAIPVNERILRPVQNQIDGYNDSIVLFGTHLQAFKATVDPGLYYTNNPLNPSGAAHLLNGHWQYSLGKHQGKPALVQAAPVTVRRDHDKDGKPENNEPLQTGWFGINIHAGGNGPIVGRNSAGCQVIQGDWNSPAWTTFYGHIKASGQKHFEYYLLDFQDLLDPLT